MSIFNLSRLRNLKVSSNRFLGFRKLDMFRKLGNLTSLDLSNNNLSINANVMAANLSSFPNFTSIKLASCNLSRFLNS
ncbi:hypothetical protein L6164_000007 [Bauhinia variegata]|uniref:Uncharacterized protein n=1 Tax=Bauhinia variegata TaxID=167791 RepID=A0ACB9Q7V9_BAUVA|nr:hypothetical protein L6164_000007 [Bauhinia variegata]